LKEKEEKEFRANLATLWAALLQARLTQQKEQNTKLK